MLQLFNMAPIMKGCSNISRAVYFAPDEVRTCCQRFFRGNELCGDVVLLKVRNLSESEIAQKIISSKQSLLQLINSDSPDPCTGCHSLNDDPESILISHISIEDSTVCNMRCTYCSPVYYGGQTSTYDVSKVLTCLSELGYLSDSCSIYWGGGEPVISQNFADKLRHIIGLQNLASLRFFSNSLIYSEELANVLSLGRGQLTTSIDAGTEATFSTVRKARNIRRVLSHLDNYISRAQNPLQVTVKYILTHENSLYDELESFISLYLSYPNLPLANLQISMDFKEATNSMALLSAALDLFYLYTSRVRGDNAYLDDHILHAISKLMVDNLFNHSSFASRPEVIRLEELARTGEWVVVGDGSFAEYLANNTYLASLKPPRAVVLLDPSSRGIAGLPSISPEEVAPSDSLVIGSVSYRDKILSKLSSALNDSTNIVNYPVF